MVIWTDVFIMPILHTKSPRNSPKLSESQSFIQVSGMRIPPAEKRFLLLQLRSKSPSSIILEFYVPTFIPTNKSSEEVLNLAKAEGIELTDEQLEAVSGGGCGGQKKKVCPKCNSTNIMKIGEDLEDGRMRYDYVCQDCLHRWSTRGADF